MSMEEQMSGIDMHRQFAETHMATGTAGAPAPTARAIMRLEAAYHRLGVVGNELEKRLHPILAPDWTEPGIETLVTTATEVSREPSPLVGSIEEYATRFESEIDRLSRIIAGLDT